MKKSISMLSAFCAIVLCLSCGSNNSSNEKTVQGDINKIDVSVKMQHISNGKQKVVVWITNKSEYIFSGELGIKLESADNTELGRESITIENLVPKQKTYAIMWAIPSTSANYTQTWTSIKFTEEQKATNTSEYKLLKDKTDSSGVQADKLEFYLAPNRDYKKMYEFIKNRKVNSGYTYHAVFVDNEKYAKFSKYPISSMTFDDDVSKHIIATYESIPSNGHKEFNYYEKNSLNSVAKTIE